METTIESTKHYYEKRDTHFFLGLGLIALCLSSYLFVSASPYNTYHVNFIIILNYSCVLLYFAFMTSSNYVQNRKFFQHTNRYQYICFLTLATISCLTLNLGINVFDKFSFWVDLYMIAMYGGLLAFCFRDQMPRQVRTVIFFTLGMGTALATYFTLYLLPLMPFGILLCFFFGVTLHLVVPLLVLINSIILFIRTEKNQADKTAYALGLGAPILISVLFTMQWHQTNQLIETTYTKQEHSNAYGLPAWVTLSQKLSDGFFTQRILKGEILYTTLYGDSWSFGRNTGTSFQDRKEHDPLIAIASYFSGRINLSRNDRIQILKFYSKNRHDTQRKLWSGKHLSTTQIKKKISLYPAYRLAYIEQTFTIKNNSSSSWRQEEALYTFTLPEGSVASSLSLWVNGIEQPSRLTTRGKADSAYVNIVGVERRDPALLHWQEGNQLTVTVFPCTSKEDRIFKIGITSPLVVDDSELVLAPITFEGPTAVFAEEEQQVDFPIQRNKTYQTHFNGSITCDKMPLSKEPFYFNHQNFNVREYQTQQRHFEPQHIYLDVNKSWSESEFTQVCNSFIGKPIFMFDNGVLIQVDAYSLDAFKNAQNNNFSLFPIELIEHPETALLVSKSTSKSPNLSDLKETHLGHTTMTYLEQKEAPIAFYNLSSTLSPYLQSLKEFYVFDYAQGSIQELRQLAKRHQFPLQITNSNQVVLHQANMLIQQKSTDNPTISKAPDHLMRLFSYHQILKKIGKGYFLSGYENQDLVNIASTAHIVSPISSMIVLETQEDYERFDIEANEEGLGNASNKNGLKNASNNSSGAVPEPHEWCFIILITLGILFVQVKRIRP
ncbi:XrtN system VIT domain-containing protein [Aureispira sp. CCB-E]|uniref:XrtN system VIT domain-containing protein n=1 Tax=Aureispira sp. CCB-E TaxID=3051121 RepID=UPI0028691F0A|nr:XrtN system VIT domain-containing protein [Aureispira sp. CCB-E]WMX12118.1 XrtN system VIT domain-containing protein [Aureispira sp. CCB-E]